MKHDMTEAPAFALGDVLVQAFSAERMTVCRMQAPAGTVVAAHSHPHEQVALVIDGRIRISAGGAEPFEAVPGDLVHFPSHVEHGVEVLEDSLFWDIFCPVREEFMAKAAKAAERSS